VKSRRKLKLFLIVVLAVTLPLKAFTRDTAKERPWESAQPSIVAFLDRHGFSVRHGFETPDEQRPAEGLMQATSGACRLLIGQMDPNGYNLVAFNRLARSVGRVAFVFNGVVYREAPLARTIADYVWMRLRQRLGLHVYWHPAYAVAATDKCALEALPWSEIAKFS
jgi:hypothetical protein